MDILFEKDDLRQDCNESKRARKRWGAQMAKRIGRRLDDLVAAPNLEAMRNLPGRCHELKGDRAGQLTVDLVHPQRLVFEPADEPVPTKPDGGLEWKQVTTIRILSVEDTHD